MSPGGDEGHKSDWQSSWTVSLFGGLTGAWRGDGQRECYSASQPSRDIQEYLVCFVRYSVLPGHRAPFISTMLCARRVRSPSCFFHLSF